MKHSWHSKDFDRISLTLNNSPTTCACGSQAVCRVDLVSSPGARDVAVATLFLLPKIRPWWSCRRPKLCFLFSASCLTQSCRTVVLLTQLLPTACFIVLVKDERPKLKCELCCEKSYERSIAFFDKTDVDRNWVCRITGLTCQFWNNVKVASFNSIEWSYYFFQVRSNRWNFFVSTFDVLKLSTPDRESRSSSVWKLVGETNKK